MAASQLNLVVLIVLLTIKSISGSMIHFRLYNQQLECFCEEGCYTSPEISWRLSCCTDICEDSKARSTHQQCKKQCPCYHLVKTLQENYQAKLNNRTDHATSLLLNVEALREKVRQKDKMISDLKKELTAATADHKELSESRQFIAAIVTPLCLFGVLALVFVVYSCAKKPGNGSGNGSVSGSETPSMRHGSTLSSKSNSISHLLRSSKFSDFRRSSDGKDGESSSNTCSLRPTCLRSASANFSGHSFHHNVDAVDGVLLAKSMRSNRSSIRSTISTTVPALRPQNLEADSSTRSHSPCSHLAFPRQAEVKSGDESSSNTRVPVQPIFQPLATNFNPGVQGQHLYQLPRKGSATKWAGGDATMLGLRNHPAPGAMAAVGAMGTAASPLSTALRMPRYGEQPSNSQPGQNRRELELRDAELKKTKLDSSAYKLASLNITDPRMTTDQSETKISD